MYNQGSDPSTYEMIQKIHTLQRRLIQKTEEVSLIFCSKPIVAVHGVVGWTSVGGREGADDSREGEAVHGAKADSAAAAWARSGRATSNLPADPQGKDQANEGVKGLISRCTPVRIV